LSCFYEIGFYEQIKWWWWWWWWWWWCSLSRGSNSGLFE